ncbi:MAG: SWIM zinc finger family protein [Nitrospirota bacterium]
MPLPEITEDIIHEIDSVASLSKGYSYFHGGAVEKVWIEKDAYKAHVYGSELYTVTIKENKGTIQTDCTCPYDWGGVCKHVVAALLAICNDKKIKEHKKDAENVKSLINKVDTDRLKKFLFQILTTNSHLLEDFKIFARGKEETENTSEKYKKKILSFFKRLKDIEYYYDHYRDSYEHPISEIIDKFTEAAPKYAAQENYKEAIKIYQGICDACIESLRNEKLEDFYDDIHYEAQQAFYAIAENIRKLSVSLKDKKPYLDYLLQAYNEFEDKEVFKDVFLKIINSPEDADYVLNKHGIDLIPPIKLNILIVKGESESVFSFGEKHYKEYPEIAVHLSEFYLKNNLRDKAIVTAEKAVEIIRGRGRDFYSGISLSDPLKELREFLDKYYSLENDYPKIIENLIMLLKSERDIAYYRKLRKIIKTAQEKIAVIERLERLLDRDYDLLFKIYSIEDDYERMLNLARESIRFDVSNLIVKKIRDRYPEECFELYKKKINKFVEDVKSRDAYRQTAYWLKLMKEIPGTQDKFKKYIEHLREKYRRRPAFIDEIKGI